MPPSLQSHVLFLELKISSFLVKTNSLCKYCKAHGNSHANILKLKKVRHKPQPQIEFPFECNQLFRCKLHRKFLRLVRCNVSHDSMSLPMRKVRIACVGVRSEAEILMKLETRNLRTYRVNDAKFSLSCCREVKFEIFLRRPLADLKSYFLKRQIIGLRRFLATCWTLPSWKLKFQSDLISWEIRSQQSSISGARSDFHFKRRTKFRGI